MSLTKKPIQFIRDNFTQFGYDLSHLTDEQLEQGIIKSATVIHNTTMFTINEATKAVIEFSKVINDKERIIYK